MKTSGVVLVLALLTFIPLHADDREEARVDLVGETDRVEITVQKMSEGGQSRHAEWRKEFAPYQVNATFPAGQSWRQGSITFQPKSSGKVVLQLAGPNVKAKNKIPETVWIAYDEVKVEGAALENGSFEAQHPGGQPKEWHVPPFQTDIVGYIKKGDAAEGHKYAVVWHNSRYAQTLQVTGGKPVTVTFQYRLEPER